MVKNDKKRVIELADLIGKSGLTEYQMRLVNELFDISCRQHSKAVKTLEISVTQNEVITERPKIH